MLTLIEETHRSPIANPVKKILNDNDSTGCKKSVLLVARTGEEIPVDKSTAPIRDTAGTLLGAVLILRDITIRLQMERALRESEECFRNAFDNATIGMALIDVKGHFLQVNLALCTPYSGIRRKNCWPLPCRLSLMPTLIIRLLNAICASC